MVEEGFRRQSLEHNSASPRLKDAAEATTTVRPLLLTLLTSFKTSFAHPQRAQHQRPVKKTYLQSSREKGCTRRIDLFSLWWQISTHLFIHSLIFKIRYILILLKLFYYRIQFSTKNLMLEFGNCLHLNATYVSFLLFFVNVNFLDIAQSFAK